MKTFATLFAVALILATANCYAAEQADGNAVVNGITNVVKMPVTLLQKASDSLDKSAPVQASEDDVTKPIYDLDAETTG